MKIGEKLSKTSKFITQNPQFITQKSPFITQKSPFITHDHTHFFNFTNKGKNVKEIFKYLLN